MRDLVSKDKVEDVLGMAAQGDLWLLHAYTHTGACTQIREEIIGKRSALRGGALDRGCTGTGQESRRKPRKGRKTSSDP